MHLRTYQFVGVIFAHCCVLCSYETPITGPSWYYQNHASAINRLRRPTREMAGCFAPTVKYIEASSVQSILLSVERQIDCTVSTNCA